MEKIDYRKAYHEIYTAPSNKVQEVNVPKLQFLMIDGRGRPEGSEAFQSAIAALYSVAFTIKFGRKKAGLQPDYAVSPLEGLWWMAGGDESFDLKRPEDWRWTLMVMQPDFITVADVAAAVAQQDAKKPNPALGLLRLGSLQEGRAVQITNIGPYDAEGPSLKRLVDYAASHSLAFHGRHHEIYVGDPRRAQPDKLRTILRHPVEAVPV